LADIAALTALIEPEAKALGFELVRVAMFGGKSDPTLQIMAERPDTRQLDLSDCEALSRRVSDVLDASDPIEEAYRLEVSSPGIDRPLTRLMDFARWSGHEAKIELHAPVSVGESQSDQNKGRKRLRGVLLGLDGQDVAVRVDNTDIKFPFRAIANAKLVLTDKLINEDLKARKGT